MTTEDLEKLVSGGEGAAVEFKETTGQRGGRRPYAYDGRPYKRPEATGGLGSGSDLAQSDPDPIQMGPDVDPDKDDKLSVRLLEIVRFNPLISRKLLAVELNVSERKVRETLKNLRESGVILRQGADHGGIWRISRIAKTSIQGTAQGVGKRVGSYTESAAKGLLSHETINETISETIRTRPGITRAALIALVGKSRATVARAVAELVDAGSIERRGSKKTGGYYARKEHGTPDGGF